MDVDEAQRGTLAAAERATARLEAERAELRGRARATADRAEAARLARRADGLRVAAGGDVPASLTKRVHTLPRPPLDGSGHARARRHDRFATAAYLRALLGDEEALAAARVRRAEERVARTAATLGRGEG